MAEARDVAKWRSLCCRETLQGGVKDGIHVKERANVATWTLGNAVVARGVDL